jgi:hypothetical protein
LHKKRGDYLLLRFNNYGYFSNILLSEPGFAGLKDYQDYLVIGGKERELGDGNLSEP